MPCYCGGCWDCLAAQGKLDEPEHCPVCGTVLAEDNDGGFCGPDCEALYVAEMAGRDTTLALQLREEAELAARYWSKQEERHEAMIRALLLEKED